MENWLQLVEPANSPAYNMACDEWLLHDIGRLAKPVLRIYGWDRPSLSIGYFQDHRGRDTGKSLVRRPTGGGAVDHTRDATYSVILPRSHPWCAACACDRYQQVHRLVLSLFTNRSITAQLAGAGRGNGTAARPNGDCFSEPTRHDILLAGKKVGGSAQRLTREGLLHQGSVLLHGDPWTAEEWRKAMLTAGIRVEPMELSEAMTSEIEALAESKYGRAEWNQKR